MSVLKPSRTRLSGRTRPALRQKKKYGLGFVVVVVCSAIILAACGSSAPTASSASSAPTKKATNMLTIALATSTTTMDPQASPLIANRYVWDLSYQCLYTTNSKGALEPQLATSYAVSSNGLIYTFNLRHGVLFQNGQPFTSADVVYTFHRLMTSGTAFARAQFATYSSVKALSKYQVQFTLSSPQAGFIDAQANPLDLGCAIMSAHTGGTNLATHMVGTGPFKQVSYIPNTSVTLARFNRYWGTKALTKALTVLFVPSASSQIADLTSGKVNLIFTSVAGAQQLKANKSIVVDKFPTAIMPWLQMNFRTPPFNNLDVRRAIALAINRQQIASVAYQGGAVPTGYIPPIYSWGTPVSKLPYSTPNIAEAKSLMQKAGYPNGFTTGLIYIPNYDPGTNAMVQLIASQLATIGIKIKLQPLETAAWLAKNTTTANYGLSWNEEGYVGDPFRYVGIPVAIKPPYPSGISALISKAYAATNATAYEKALNALGNKEASIVFPSISLVAEDAFVAYSSSLQGVHPNGSESTTFMANVSLK